MLSEIFYASWSYSCYLTLKEWQIIIYLLLLLLGLVNGFLNVFAFSTVSLLFYIITLVYLGFALWFAFFAYKAFRMTGGIHGGISKKEREGRSLKENLIQKGS